MDFTHLQKLAAKKLVFVNLIFAQNQDGEEAYCYFAVMGDNMLKLHQDMRRGSLINPSDYGYVLKEGMGYPAEDVRNEIEQKFGYRHDLQVPIRMEDSAAEATG